MGFNRMSLGVQDFNRRRADRRQPHAARRRRRLRSRGCRASRGRSVSLSFDLIYGLPRQTLASFERTLDSVIDARPNRLAVYAYAHMPRLFKAQQRITRRRAADAGATPATARSSRCPKLTAAGYVYIGMDHFALPDDELVRAKERRLAAAKFSGLLHACGARSHRPGRELHRQGGADTYAQSFKSLPEYYAADGLPAVCR